MGCGLGKIGWETLMTLARVEPLVEDAVTTVDPGGERELVERAKRDASAFAALYRQHYRAVARYVYRRTGDTHATDDLVSEVFLTALRTLPRFRYRGIPVRFWLFRIATNAINHWARRNRRRKTTDVPSDYPAPQSTDADSARGDGEAELARKALLSLPPKHQAVLALHHLEGLTLPEVAAVLGCRLGTVKSRLTRAREKLRAAMTERGDIVRKNPDPIDEALRSLRNQDWPGNSCNPELENLLMQKHSVNRSPSRLTSHPVLVAAVALLLLGSFGFAAAGGVQMVKGWFIRAEVDGREVNIDNANLTVEEKEDGVVTMTVDDIQISPKPGDPEIEDGEIVTLTITGEAPPEDD